VSGLLFGRLGQTALVLIVVSLVVFCLQALAPIDPARKALTIGGASELPDERDVEAKRKELGLDRPLPERYVRWLADVATFDLGESFVNKKPVAGLIGERVAASATLAVLTVGFSTVIALPLGIVAATRAGTWADSIIRALSLLGASLPAFWLALLAMWLFSVELRLLPALGSFTPEGIVLPALVLTARTVGLLARLMRATMLDALNQDYVRTALSKGLPDRTVVRRHVAPNAITPVLAVIGLDFAALFGEAAVVEWVFAWPGIGRMGVEGALAGDLPVVMGFVLVVCLFFVLANLAVDLACGLVDPRQREEGALV
jgi:ABC-type dipeptide/oligopeptide/nickel transport system permease component